MNEYRGLTKEEVDQLILVSEFQGRISQAKEKLRSIRKTCRFNGGYDFLAESTKARLMKREESLFDDIDEIARILSAEIGVKIEVSIDAIEYEDSLN